MNYSALDGRRKYTKRYGRVDKCRICFGYHDFEHQTIDPGTAYELGVATMLKKPMIIVQEETVPTNLMITQSLHTYLKIRPSCT